MNPRALLLGLTMASAIAVLPGCGPSGSGSFMGRTVADLKKSQMLTYVAERSFVDYVGTTPMKVGERFHRSADGFRLELLSVNGKVPGQMSAEEYGDFDRLDRLLAGGKGRYVAGMRDFEVRDSELFLGMYAWTVFEAPAAPVAGREVIVGEIKPLRMDRPWYRVWVDQESLVTLKYEEFLPSGVLASEMEVLSIEYSFDTSQDMLRSLGRPGGTDLDGLEQVSSFVPFQAVVPSYLPEGFVLNACQVFPTPHGPAARFTYGDGIQELVVTQYADPPANEPLPEGVPVRVGMTVYGSTVDADLVLLGTRVHVTCKVSDGELMAVIEGLEQATP